MRTRARSSRPAKRGLVVTRRCASDELTLLRPSSTITTICSRSPTGKSSASIVSPSHTHHGAKNERQLEPEPVRLKRANWIAVSWRRRNVATALVAAEKLDAELAMPASAGKLLADRTKTLCGWSHRSHSFLTWPRKRRSPSGERLIATFPAAERYSQRSGPFGASVTTTVVFKCGRV